MPYINYNTGKKVKMWEGITGTFYHSEQATLAHVTIQKGVELPQHNHIHEQWTNVIEGELLFNINGEERLLTKGMAAFVPSNIPHSAKAITECKVIDFFLPVRQDLVELEKNQIRLNRTDGNNPDFINLVRQLDKYLADIFGVKQKYYDQFNIINNSNIAVVAYDNNSPVGCGCFREFDTNTVEVKRMFVPATHRNKGIATAILLELEKWAKELGYIKIILETGTLLTEANNLYHKHNYHVTEKWGQYVGVETSVCMKKILT